MTWALKVCESAVKHNLKLFSILYIVTKDSIMYDFFQIRFLLTDSFLFLA